MPKKRTITKTYDDKQFMNLYKKHKGNQSAMAREMGVNRSTVCHRLRKNPQLQITLLEEINAVADDLGIDMMWYMEKLKSGAEANSIHYFKKSGKKEKGKKGKQISDEFIEVADLDTRHKYLVTMGKLMRYIETYGVQVNVAIQHNTTISEEVARIEEEQKKSSAI